MMIGRARDGRIIGTLCLLSFLLLCAFLDTAYAYRAEPALTAPKNDPVLTIGARHYLERTTKDGLAKIWVYFTDKGIFDNSGLAAAIDRQTAKLPAKALERRAKVGMEKAAFVDLPVRDSYVSAVRQLGGQLRRVSHWLNAASFNVDLGSLDAIAALPFVKAISPVAGYTAPKVEIGSPPLRKPIDIESQTALDYGPALGQLTMINVPAAHVAGYDGTGVLVCMMDTGYRKDHTAFADAFSEGRVVAEHDFIFNDGNTQDELEDVAGQHNHGTYTWSTLGGAAPGNVYGPAYKAEFLLAKTEDMRSETAVEEDNWVAGMEWADSYGADVISSSLGYSDWYTTSDYDGNTCVTTIAADIAASLGIVVCNSLGNNGNYPTSLNAPADADSILSVGAVGSTEVIASFSSRGPTFDGRTKPEVCAQGVNTRCATATSTISFGYINGTSLSCPLVGGAAALVIQAHPTWTPMMVREALMQTADNAATPDNTYGWGIIDVMAAIDYSFGCDCADIGDNNGDGTIDPVDAVILVNFVYRNWIAPPVIPGCVGINGDWDCNGTVNPVDVVRAVNYVYRNIDHPCDPCACESYPDICP
jgi:serine protease AprX